MLLAIDIGNTHTVLGCIEDGDIKSIARISSDASKTAHEYAVIIKSVLEFENADINALDGAIISSVVPNVTMNMRNAVQALTGKKPLIVGSGVKTGLDIRIDNPAEAGSDLIVGAVAALNIAKPPLIVIDMGTATTICAIDKNGCFIGGVIYPGVKVAFSALSGGASQLPDVAIEAPPRCIGTNTIDSMRSGGVFGTASLLDGMIDRINDELGEKAGVIATGGLARYIIPYCKHEITYDGNLLLKGLEIIYYKNRKK